MNGEHLDWIKEKDIYEQFIKKLLTNDCEMALCDFCIHDIKCPCELYQRGKGGILIEQGEEKTFYSDMEWTCMDFTLCAKHEGTPCEKCYVENFGVNLELDFDKIKKYLEDNDD